MAKKRKKKRKNPPRRNGPRSNGPKGPRGNPRRGSRRRRNPSGGSSPWAIVGGVLGGGLIGGALDYGLAGMAVTASPTRRAMVFGGLTLVGVATAAMTDGNVSAVASGVAGAQAGLAFANTGRAVAVWVASSDEKKAQKDDKTPNADPAGRTQGVVMRPDSAMRAVVQRGIPTRQPAELEQPRRVAVNRTNLRAVVMGRG